MPVFPHAALGYSRQEVDTFVARIEGTLGRSPLYAPPVTADVVRAVRFARRVGGYQMKAVDEALDRYIRELEDEAGTNRLRAGEVDQLVGLVRNVRFGTTRLKGGYDERQVDAFLNKMIVALRENRARPSEVNKAVFDVTRTRPGYRQSDVDAFLDRLSSEIGRLRSGG